MGSLAQNFFAAANDRKTMLENEKNAVLQSLAEEGVVTISDLDSRIENQKTEKDENDKAHAAFNSQKKQELLNTDRALAEQFKPFHAAQKKLEDLRGKEAEMAEKRAQYEKAERAEALRTVVSDYEKAEAEYGSRFKTWKDKQALLPDAQQRYQDAWEAKQAHDANSPVSALQTKIGEYEAKQPFYQKLSQLRELLTSTEQVLTEQNQTTAEAIVTFEEARQKAQNAFGASEAAEQTAREFRTRYYAGIYGEIASQLADDVPCPVCGSIHHPNPAEKSVESVGKEEMEAKETAAQESKEVWKTLEGQRETAEDKKRTAENCLREAEKSRDDAAAALRNAEANLIDKIPDSNTLESRLNKLRKEITQYQSESEQLRNAAEEAKETLDKLNAQIDSAGEECRNAEKLRDDAKSILDTALTQNGYEDYLCVKQDLLSDKKRKAMHTELVEYDRDVQMTAQEIAQMQQELTGLEEPDTAQFDARQAEITEETNTYVKRSAELQAEIARLIKKRATLQKKWTHFETEIGEAENNLAFAKKLRGDSGIGLQRYVLAIMFNQVIGEANRMLEKVHGGRYRLYRSDDKGAGNKRGLELKVYDNRSPDTEGRSVAMLSGGEKFLVSLSLSIGMSTVAQKTGVQIEALFIDEGFGTLDDSSIHDAMDILESVRRSSGMIGIISHVQLLENNIPTHLEVIKANGGSTIVPV